MKANYNQLIQDWLDKNGGARRFEMWTMSSRDALVQFLIDRGYAVRIFRNSVTVTKGKKIIHKCKSKQLRSFVDEIRIASGKLPLKLSKAA